MYFYKLYGLNLESVLPFPELEPVLIPRPDSNKRISLKVHRFIPPASRETVNYGGLRYWFGSDNKTAIISARAAGNFRIRFDERTIEWMPPAAGDGTSLACHLLKGRVLGLLLSHMPSYLLLHANVLSGSGKAMLFLGAHGGGKSTLSAFLLKKGFSLMSDDVAVMQRRRGRFLIESGAPELRLWPGSAARLVPSVARNESLPETLKRRLILERPSSAYLNDSLPPSAFYILTRRRTARIELRSIKSAEALLGILKNIYLPVIKNPRVLNSHFEMAAELAKNFPVKELVYPTGICHLPRIHRALMRDAILL